MNENAII